MKLKNSAKHALKTPIEALDASGSWVPWGTGRFSTVDRFLSNFHRPLQRRMFFSDPDVPLPASGVIKNSITQEIYLVGQSRHDTDENEAYTRLTVAHYVAGGNTNRITLKRKVVDPLRDPFTIGELVDSVVGTYYGTFEHKMTSETYNSDDHFLSKFVVFFPYGTDIESNDTLVDEDGVEYQVEGHYEDSHFISLVAQRKPDQRVTGTYHLPNALFGYDIATGVVNKSYDDYLFTCEKSMFKSDGTGAANLYDADIYVKTPSLPIEPQVGYKITVEGTCYLIQRIERNYEADFQYRLMCNESVL